MKMSANNFVHSLDHFSMLPQTQDPIWPVDFSYLQSRINNADVETLCEGNKILHEAKRKP